MDIFNLYLFFWIISFLGWIVEMIFCAAVDKKIVNRGFLIGPYLPIYGCGGVIMLLFLPYKDHPLIVFVLSLVSCSVIEYFTSYIMEKLFKVRWWDYSKDSFNINGRVCLRNAIAFGALGVVLTKYIYPLIENLLNNLSLNVLYIIDIIILLVTLIDIIISFNAMTSIKNIISKNIKNYKNIDATSDIRKLLHKKFNYNYFQKRLLETYHLLGKDMKKIYQKFDNSSYKILIVCFFISLVMGIILSYIYQKYSFVTLCVSIGILISFIIRRRKIK